MAGRKCTICFHKQQAEIDKAIARGDSLRGIAVEFGIKSTTNLERHIENHLGMRVGAIRIEKAEQSRINVEQEFERMLTQIRRLDDAVEAYLSDPDDPLLLNIDPRADEIEVVYFDHNDLFMGNPKKKKANLQILFIELAQGLGYQPDKFTIKHVDMRDWILKVKGEIRATLQEIGKIQGVYKAPEVNDPKVRAVNAIKTMMALMPGITEKEAMEAILAQQRETNMMIVEPSVMRQVARDNGILQLEGIQ